MTDKTFSQICTLKTSYRNKSIDLSIIHQYDDSDNQQDIRECCQQSVSKNEHKADNVQQAKWMLFLDRKISFEMLKPAVEKQQSIIEMTMWVANAIVKASKQWTARARSAPSAELIATWSSEKSAGWMPWH